jgi:hypothetical protein
MAKGLGNVTTSVDGIGCRNKIEGASEVSWARLVDIPHLQA